MHPADMPQFPPLAITMGDPLGIGPELVVRLAADPQYAAHPYVVVGDAGCLQRAAQSLGLAVRIRRLEAPHEARHLPRQADELLVVQTGADFPADAPLGRVDARAGAASYSYVQCAIDLVLAGEISGIVTAPINKAAMRAAGIHYPGHTEILADRAGTKDFAMMLANDELRVLLVSIHVSLQQAIEAVTFDNELRAIKLAHQACLAFGCQAPRVAVAGLNPHASEDGLFGNQERTTIEPAIAAARAAGIDASGPWPGDTVFMRARRGEFDVVVAQYHDQGLIPVKYLGVEQGVNITVGLPFVRTSVDHGTAFDIAGKGLADPASLGCALRQAAAMARVSAGQAPIDTANAPTAPAHTPAPRQPQGRPEFIFMLTRQDRTIEDAEQRLQEVLAEGVKHIGFKDIGLPLERLTQLARTIQAAGALAYLEVVSQDEASEAASARAAVALGVDVLMGGTRPDTVLPIIAGSGIRYYPFPGRVTGHPSVLNGPIEDIVASARRIAALPGVDGLDLLAYRFDGDVPALIDAVCAAVDKPVYIAGSIDRAERVAVVARSKAAGFTVGTAALDGVFRATGPGLPAQLRAIDALIDSGAAIGAA